MASNQESMKVSSWIYLFHELVSFWNMTIENSLFKGCWLNEKVLKTTQKKKKNEVVSQGHKKKFEGTPEGQI